MCCGPGTGENHRGGSKNVANTNHLFDKQQCMVQKTNCQRQHTRAAMTDSSFRHCCLRPDTCHNNYCNMFGGLQSKTLATYMTVQHPSLSIAGSGSVQACHWKVLLFFLMVRMTILLWDDHSELGHCCKAFQGSQTSVPQGHTNQSSVLNCFSVGSMFEATSGGSMAIMMGTTLVIYHLPWPQRQPVLNIKQNNPSIL